MYMLKAFPIYHYLMFKLNFHGEKLLHIRNYLFHVPTMNKNFTLVDLV